VTERYCFDDVEVDPVGFRMLKSGKAVPVEPKALQVLVFLLANRGRLVEKGELLSDVWNDAFVKENVLSRAIAQLRKALADDAKAARYIETVPTKGYRFIANVQVVTDSTARPSGPATTSHYPKAQRFWLAAALVAALGIAVAWWAWIGNRPRPLEVRQSIQVTTASGLSIYPTFSPDGSAMAYAADHGKGFEIFVRQLAPGGREVQITSDGGQNVQPAWSPNGQFVSYHSYKNNGIWIVSALGGSVRRVSETGSHPAWSRSGEWIAFQSAPLTDLSGDSSGVFPPSTIWRIRPDGRDATAITRAGVPEGGHGSPSWSSDGKHLVFVSVIFGHSSVWATDTNGSPPVRVSPEALGNYDPIYTLDGKSVLYGAVTYTGNYGLWQVKVMSDTSAPAGEPVQVLNSGGLRVKNLSLSSDGKRVLFSGVSLASSLQSLPLSPSGEPAGPPVAISSDVGCRSFGASFSPDGSRIAFSSCRGLAGSVPQVWLMSADGSNKEPLTTGPSPSGMPRWFPKGNRVIFLEGHYDPKGLYSIDLETRQQKLVAPITQAFETFDLSPDGKHVAFSATSAGAINLWLLNLDDSTPRQLTFDKEMIGFPIWSPDGKFIAAEIQRGRDVNIALLPADSGALTQITFDRALNWPHSWSSDGDKIFFAKREPAGPWNIWYVSRSTRQQHQLTHYERLNAFVRYPRISPRGNQLVYESTESTGNIWMLEFK